MKFKMELKDVVLVVRKYADCIDLRGDDADEDATEKISIWLDESDWMRVAVFMAQRDVMLGEMAGVEGGFCAKSVKPAGKNIVGWYHKLGVSNKAILEKIAIGDMSISPGSAHIKLVDVHAFIGHYCRWLAANDCHKDDVFVKELTRLLAGGKFAAVADLLAMGGRHDILAAVLNCNFAAGYHIVSMNQLRPQSATVDLYNAAVKETKIVLKHLSSGSVGMSREIGEDPIGDILKKPLKEQKEKVNAVDAPLPSKVYPNYFSAIGQAQELTKAGFTVTIETVEGGFEVIKMGKS